jgi:hypothetical protein
MEYIKIIKKSEIVYFCENGCAVVTDLDDNLLGYLCDSCRFFQGGTCAKNPEPVV